MTLVTPSPDRMLTWLQGPEVVDGTGRVYSWHNPDRPGYAYPEVAGLVLSALSKAGADLAIRQRVADQLIADVGEDGGVGRWGASYVFDTSMALSGLIAHERAGGTVEDSIVRRMFEFLYELLAERKGVRGRIVGDPDHWSLSFGPHLLKAALAISDFQDRSQDRRCDELIDELFEVLAPMATEGRYPSNAQNGRSYLHAHCYALEGLLRLASRRREAGSLVHEGVAWLATVQNEDGGVRAWHDGREATGEVHADCTAQAVRLWGIVDAGRYAAQIQAGSRMLAALQVDTGGIRYEPGSRDVNTWATVFGIQAVAATTSGLPPADVI